MLAEKFRHKDGPFFQSLDCALATLHVERQAYHGGTFVGNHVHKLLKVLHKSFDVLTINLYSRFPMQSTSLHFAV